MPSRQRKTYSVLFSVIILLAGSFVALTPDNGVTAQENHSDPSQKHLGNSPTTEEAEPSVIQTRLGVVPAVKVDRSTLEALNEYPLDKEVTVETALSWDEPRAWSVADFESPDTVPQEALLELTPRQRAILNETWVSSPAVSWPASVNESVQLNDDIRRLVADHNARIFTNVAESLERDLEVTAPGAEVVSDYHEVPPSVGGLTLEMEVQHLPALLAHPHVAHASVVEDLSTRLRDATPQIQADHLWSSGYTGSGMLVSVIDSGIENSLVPVVASKDFSNEGNTDDGCGHGTAVAGMVASTDSTDRGPAYQAGILDAKLVQSDCQTGGSFSDAVSWSINQDADVIQVSLGPAQTDDGDHTWDWYLDRAGDAYGVISTVAAGNNGNDPAHEVLVPAGSYNVFSVGAAQTRSSTDPANAEGATFSAWGFTDETDSRPKPDMLAPGTTYEGQTGVHSTVPPSGTATSWDSTCGCTLSGSIIEGTSFAAPMAAGVAAQLYQKEGWMASRAVDAFHSAMLAGVSPDHDIDYRSGYYDGGHAEFAWGFIDANFASQVSTYPGTIKQGATTTIYLNDVTPNAELWVGLHWLRHTGTSEGTWDSVSQLTISNVECTGGGTNGVGYEGNSQRLFVTTGLGTECSMTVEGVDVSGSEDYVLSWVIR